MSEAAIDVPMSAAEFLVWERGQPGKHEFLAGEVFAMAGGSPRHNLLAGAMVAELRAATAARGCRVLSSDQRIAAPAGKRYVYADAVVVCGPLEAEPDTSDVLCNPTIVVEVLSPSTEAHDRGAKWQAYQQIDSLSDYLLLTQTEARIEHYRREPDGTWRYQVCGPGGVIELAGGTRFEVDAVYLGAFELSAG
jgi:Uma2 family endonuclease